MSRAPLNVIEWLEDMRRFASRDADRATEVLELIGVAQATEDLLTDLSEDIGDFDEAKQAFCEFDSLTRWAEQDDLISAQMGDTLEQRLVAVMAHYTKYEAQSFALSELCMAAGLLNQNDYTTDPLPLLRMFLPVDE